MDDTFAFLKMNMFKYSYIHRYVCMYNRWDLPLCRCLSLPPGAKRQATDSCMTRSLSCSQLCSTWDRFVLILWSDSQHKNVAQDAQLKTADPFCHIHHTNST